MTDSDVIKLFWLCCRKLVRRLATGVFTTIHAYAVRLRVCLVSVVGVKLPQVPLLRLDLLVELR